jgi:hypothetical protein
MAKMQSRSLPLPDDWPGNWDIVAGPRKIRPPFVSYESHEIVNYLPADVAKHMLQFPGMRLVHAANPKWWDWKARWKLGQSFIEMGMQIFETEPITWAGFSLKTKCSLDEFMLLWGHLQRRFPAAWLHNVDSEYHSPKSFRDDIVSGVINGYSISINTAPVLALWASVVAARLGFDRDEALTLGRAVAEHKAAAKGSTLPVFKPHQTKVNKAREGKFGDRFLVEVCGQMVEAVKTKNGIRGLVKGKPILPASVQRYLEGEFGYSLYRFEEEMQYLAKAFNRLQLADVAYPLYEKFRPAIPSGAKGAATKGDLDPDLIASLKSFGQPAI